MFQNLILGSVKLSFCKLQKHKLSRTETQQNDKPKTNTKQWTQCGCNLVHLGALNHVSYANYEGMGIIKKDAIFCDQCLVFDCKRRMSKMNDYFTFGCLPFALGCAILKIKIIHQQNIAPNWSPVKMNQLSLKWCTTFNRWKSLECDLQIWKDFMGTICTYTSVIIFKQNWRNV